MQLAKKDLFGHNVITFLFESEIGTNKYGTTLDIVGGLMYII